MEKYRSQLHWIILHDFSFKTGGCVCDGRNPDENKAEKVGKAFFAI